MVELIMTASCPIIYYSSAMIEDFMQRKLSALLDQFIEFEKLVLVSEAGMTIQNSKIKPKLTEELSAAMKLPITLIEGSIRSLTLNQPWKKLFLFSSTPIKVTVQGVHLRTKIHNAVNQDYILRLKERLVFLLTESLLNPLEAAHSKTSYLNKKLKEYFLSTIVLELREVCVEVEVDLKQKVALIAKIDHATLRREEKKATNTQIIELAIEGVGVNYRAGQDKERQFMSPTRITFTRNKTESPSSKRTSTHHLNIERLQFNVNNLNYGDIARIIQLVKWHNSFVNVPFHLWKAKPFVLTQCPPHKKLIYTVNLQAHAIREHRLSSRQLAERRAYISLYKKMLAGPLAAQEKQEMVKMEKTMPVWKIAAFRSFCINLLRKETEDRKREERRKVEAGLARQVPQQDKESTMQYVYASASWLRSWLATEKNKEQLESAFMDKVSSITLLPSDIQTSLNLKVEEFRLKLAIVTNFGVEPFISLVGIHCEYDQRNWVVEKAWEKRVNIRKCKIEYDRYLGHHLRYRNFITESKEHLSPHQAQAMQPEQAESEDEFEDINYFLQVEFKAHSPTITLHLLPFDLYINHQIIEKFAILMNIEKLSKLTKLTNIQSNYIRDYDPWLIVEEERQSIIELKKSHSGHESVLPTSMGRVKSEQVGLTSPSLSPKKKDEPVSPQPPSPIDRQLRIQTALNLIVPRELRQYPTPEVVLQIGSLVLTKHSFTKTVSLQSIYLKLKLPQPAPEQESAHSLLKFLEPQPLTHSLIDPFDAHLVQETHESFDKLHVVIEPIMVRIPAKEHLMTLIEMIFMHIPKPKANRVRQYQRRRQSIGEQFLDACQNLNEHIAKSMIMSSEKQTRKSIREKRSKQTQIQLKGLTVKNSYLHVSLNLVDIYLHALGFNDKNVQSHNEKNIDITITNLKQLIEEAKAISLHIKQQKANKGFSPEKQESQKPLTNMGVSGIKIEVAVVLDQIMLEGSKEPLKLKVLADGLSIDQSQEERSTVVEASMQVAYTEPPPSRPMLTPILQPCELTLESHTHTYNLTQTTLSVASATINLKPSLLTFLSHFTRDYYIHSPTPSTLTNCTINSLKVKPASKNYYTECKHQQSTIVDDYQAQIQLFGNRLPLEFQDHRRGVPESKTQCIPLSSNCFLINREVSPTRNQLQSNIRIMNHQDKTIWIKVTENSSSVVQPQQRIRSILQTEYKVSNTPRRLSLNRFEPTPSSSPNYQQRGHTMNIALRPQEKIHIFIDENDFKFMQFYDQGHTFTEINLGELFEQKEIVLRNQQMEEDQLLVLRSQITQEKDLIGSIFTFHIYCPVYIVNHSPWPLEYRIGEQIVLQQPEDKKFARRRSFQMRPLNSVGAFETVKIRRVHYAAIQSMKLVLDRCEREIGSLPDLLNRAKAELEQDSYGSHSELITVMSNRREIQMVLTLTISANTLKLKLTPQYIFLNLTNHLIHFTINQNQITYPQVRLKAIPSNVAPKNAPSSPKLQRKQSPPKNSSSKGKGIPHINEYLNLSDQKLRDKQVLKQLFDNFRDYVEVFTGAFDQQLPRSMVFEQLLAASDLVNSVGLLKSQKGLVSDYNSDAEYREDTLPRVSTPLQSESVVIYPKNELILYKRTLEIAPLQHLVLFTPTIHIINKTPITFYAKSPCHALLTIPSQSHNFLLTNSPNIDLQASFEDEEISLNEWIRVRLDRFGTIYHSVDMIRHHGSGYESKEYTFRRKRMRKTPKMFYKILLCKWERGQKILVEESQYPPVSFINNTRHRIKIEELHEHFMEEFHNKGDMGEYAPENPYHVPLFHLSVADNYQYMKLCSFGVEERRTQGLEKGIILAIEEYKGKTIVNIKDKEYVNLTASILERQPGDSALEEMGEALLEATRKFTLSLNCLTIPVLSNHNHQLSAAVLQNITLTNEHKNYKQYYEMSVGAAECYDYSGLQPEYIVKRKPRNEKKVLKLLKREQERVDEPFVKCGVVVNQHKNAVVLEECEFKLTDVTAFVSVELLLSYVKAYYHSLLQLKAVKEYYLARSQAVPSKSSPALHRTFIVESMKLSGTSVSLQTRRLSLLEHFLNKRYQKWLVSFIGSLGELKPITFGSMELYYEQTNLNKVLQQINVRKKLAELGGLLMDYPLQQMREVFRLLFGDESSVRERLYTIRTLVKSIESVVGLALNLNQNLKSPLPSYTESFILQHRQSADFVIKIMDYRYCEWKYSLPVNPSQLIHPIQRLERYNLQCAALRPYDEYRARIKLALDCSLNNKVERRVEWVWVCSKEALLGVVEEWVVVYWLKESAWRVMRVEQVLSWHYEPKCIRMTYWVEQGSKKGGSHEKMESTHVATIAIKNTHLGREQMLVLEEKVAEARLSSIY